MLLCNKSQETVYGIGHLENTGYHQLSVSLVKPKTVSAELKQAAQDIARLPSFPEDEHVDAFASSPEAKAIELQVKVLKAQQSNHLACVKRQKGGIGSAAYDSKQRELKVRFSWFCIF